MFMELFYQNYSKKGDDAFVSLPYSVLIREQKERESFEQILLQDGFQCVVGENTYPLMYVNFTLKRFGRNVKACGSSTINKVPFSKDTFLSEIYLKYKTDSAFRMDLENNWGISAAIVLEKQKELLNRFRIAGTLTPEYEAYATQQISLLKQQLAVANESQNAGDEKDVFAINSRGKPVERIAYGDTAGAG